MNSNSTPEREPLYAEEQAVGGNELVLESKCTRPGCGAERIELDAVSGLRFFATFCLVCGRAIENLWIDSGSEAELLNLRLCSFLHIMASDVVSFYYVLSGFTMTWGYMSRDMDTQDVRWRYWVRRFARFYPDFAISTVLTFALKHPLLFGCHPVGAHKWIFNALSLFLFSAWYRFFPGTGYVNGPVWFIVTLFWLWMIFPFLLKPVKEAFRDGDWTSFLWKIAVLWLISFIPWTFIDDSNVDWLRWGLRCFPICRIPEFVIGMALAVRVNKDREEEESEEAAGGSDAFHPRHLAPYTPFIGLLVSVSYYAYRIATWPEGCSCLAEDFFKCWGRIHAFDTKFTPVALCVIYGVTTLDVSARAEGGSSSEAIGRRLGWFGRQVWCFLTFGPFVKVGKWGLPIFLYQASVNCLVQALLITLRLGLEDRCHTTEFSLEFAAFYVATHILMAYVAAFLMNEDGPIGRQVHEAVRNITPK